MKQCIEIKQNWTGREALISVFVQFWPLVIKKNFVEGRLGTRLYLQPVWVFAIISKFPKILSLKSFSNSWGNSYSMFFVLDFMFHFTFGELNHTKRLRNWSLRFSNFKRKFDHFGSQRINFLIWKKFCLYPLLSVP